MKKTLTAIFLTFLGLPFIVHSKALMVATAPSQETLTLTDEKADCPSGETPDGYKWDARKVIYHDPRDNEREEGCYIIDAREAPAVVIVIFKSGSLSGQPLYLPTKIFKPEI